jgi:uroporphyrinogen-III synthase
MKDRADQPLAGKSILVTRPADRGAGLVDRLGALGARVDRRPTIAFEPPQDPGPARRAISRLSEYGWVVFTSVNGVNFFHGFLQSAPRGSGRPTLRCACVGRATARALEARGTVPELVAVESHAEGLADLLLGKLRSGERVLWVRPEEARPVLRNRLERSGIEVDAVAFYRNVAAPGIGELIGDVCRRRYDAVVFTSPSTLGRLAEQSGDQRAALMQALSNSALVAIGRITARALEAQRLPVAAVAAEPSDEGIAAALLRALRG